MQIFERGLSKFFKNYVILSLELSPFLRTILPKRRNLGPDSFQVSIYVLKSYFLKYLPPSQFWFSNLKWFLSYFENTYNLHEPYDDVRIIPSFNFILRNKLFNILGSKEGLILKFGQVIEYYIMKICKEKICTRTWFHIICFYRNHYHKRGCKTSY